MHNISSFGNVTVRPIEDWEKISGNNNEQLNALIRHCFARYDVPKFLEQVFYTSVKKQMFWYVQLGKGKSVKSLSNIPVKLTSKMAHEFRNAPSYLTVNEALRYAQALGYGASTKIAKLIAFSRLSIIRDEDEDFWATVVQFFSKEKNLEVNELNSIVDYLTFKYRENSSFSIKNRTYKSLLSQSEEWHRNVYLKQNGENYSWEPSGIKPLYFEEIVDNKKVVYKTEELLSSAALFDEGKTMKHCVAEYDEDCLEQSCAIFSLRKEVEGEPIKRLVTLEVGLLNFEIVQAKAVCNQEPDKKSLELINYWVKNSQVKQQVFEEYQQVQPLAYQRMVERRQINERQEYDSALMIKVFFWILYILFRIMMMN